MTPFRWAPQEPTKVATVSQFAAPRDGEASLWSACGSSPLDLPATKLATVSQFAAPRDGDALF